MRGYFTMYYVVPVEIDNEIIYTFTYCVNYMLKSIY